MPVIKVASRRADEPRVRSWRPVLARTTGVLACVLLLTGTGPPAQADDAAAARAQAHRAATDVAVLSAGLSAASEDYATALAAVGQHVGDSVLAGTEADDAQRRALEASAVHARSARAIYMSGGQAGLMSSVLEAGDARDLALRVVGLRQVMNGVRQSAAQARSSAAASDRTAQLAADQADSSVVVVDEIAQRAAEVDALLARAQSTLDRLSARARRLTEAEEAAKALARARARAAATQRAALASVRAQAAATQRAARQSVRAQAAGTQSAAPAGPRDQAAPAQGGALQSVRGQAPPATYFELYQAAAPTCPGMPWTLLAAVGQVESGHGRNVGPSSAGALGPMQFMPGTFRGYAVDGDHDGRADIMSPADSIFTAARYLCANGAGSPSGIERALLRYNHAQWYVDLVLGVQQQIAAAQGG